MNVRELDDGLEIVFEDCSIELLQIDFRFGLRLVDRPNSCLLTISTQFRFNNLELDPEDKSTLSPALMLFNMKVHAISISPDGHMQVRLFDGNLLDIGADSRYEAWDLVIRDSEQTTSSSCQLICLPGGGITQFGTLPFLHRSSETGKSETYK